MKELNLNQMEMVSGGKWWKCALGISAVFGGIAFLVTGFGVAAAGATLGAGLTLVDKRC
jgi:hypothetical protein